MKEYIRSSECCAKRKSGQRHVVPLGDQINANEFLDVVSLYIVGLLPVTEHVIDTF